MSTHEKISAEALELYNQGQTQSQIAQRLSVSDSTVSRALRSRSDYESRGRGNSGPMQQSAEMARKICQAFAQGHSVAVIAQAAGRSKNRVHQIIKEAREV